jgi:hypothetical protein
MRENMGLYRGKDMVNGKWVSGFLVSEKHIGSFLVCEPVRPETIGQFTGLTDKNGTKIFEGDFVRVDDNVKKIFPQVEDGDVRFARGGFFVGCYGDILRSLDVIADYKGVLRGEVVGNIHDNPELLEVK